MMDLVLMRTLGIGGSANRETVNMSDRLLAYRS
jgi:hypothetical protein